MSIPGTVVSIQHAAVFSEFHGAASGGAAVDVSEFVVSSLLSFKAAISNDINHRRFLRIEHYLNRSTAVASPVIPSTLYEISRRSTMNVEEIEIRQQRVPRAEEEDEEEEDDDDEVEEEDRVEENDGLYDGGVAEPVDGPLERRSAIEADIVSINTIFFMRFNEFSS